MFQSVLLIIFQKKFGFTSLIFNLILYLTYLIPLTALSLYSRENEKKFCATNDTVPRRVSVTSLVISHSQS